MTDTSHAISGESTTGNIVPRVTQDIYQQAVSEEKRLAQDLVFRSLLEGGSPQHPRRPPERRCRFHKPLILLCLWRGRRGSNPRPLPRQRASTIRIIDLQITFRHLNEP